tara:strand:- start:822 stop:1313 length:492 start_codon:yes stop_codon:yes gene_type:complete
MNVSNGYIFKLELDDRHFKRRPAEVERERSVAIRELLRRNVFVPKQQAANDGRHKQGCYSVKIGIKDYRLIISVKDESGHSLRPITLPIRPFRRLIRDYFMICESFLEACQSGQHSRVEALDMARRSLHDEGAAILRDRLDADLIVDRLTARNLFTLLCVLHV